MIQSIYFTNTPEHARPVSESCPAMSNKALRGSMRNTTGVYAVAGEPEHFFKRKVLPLIEAARKRGDMVRFVGSIWTINGQPLEV